MRALAAAVFLMRRVRSETGALLLIGLLVGITSFLAAATPRLFNAVADAGLEIELSDATPPQRDVELSRNAPLPADQAVWDALVRAGTTMEARLPAALRALVDERAVVATSPQLELAEPPRIPTFLAVRQQGDLASAIRIVEGRLPEATREPADPAPDAGEGSPDDPAEPPRIEIALSVAAADTAGVALGDEFVATLDPADPAAPRPAGRPFEARVVVVGRFNLLDPGAETWYADDDLARARIGGTPDEPTALVTGLVAPEALDVLSSTGMAFRVEWRYFVEPSAVDVERLDELILDLRRLATEYATVRSATAPATLVLRTGLLPLLEHYRAERDASVAVLSVAAIGPIALALVALATVGLLLMSRRRETLLLALARGASSRLLLGTQLIESVLICAIAAGLGLAVASAIVPGRVNPLSPALSAAVGVLSTVVLVAVAVPAVRRPQPARASRDPATARGSFRRASLEISVIAITIVAVALLQRRGLTLTGDEAGTVGFDPFLAAVPVLVGISAGLIALRLLPIPVRTLGSLAARRRDLVPVLGFRSIGRRTSLASLPLLVLMLATAFGSFTQVVASSVAASQEAASWAVVGADYRVDGPGAAGADTSVAGTGRTVLAYADADAAFESRPNVLGRIRLLAVPAVPYEALFADAPIGPDLPAAFHRQPTTGTPVPAILSRTLPAGSAAPRIGATFPLHVGGAVLTVEIADIRSGFPGIPNGDPFLVVPLDVLATAVGRPLVPTTLFVVGPAETGDVLARLGESDVPAAVVTSRRAWVHDLQAAPLVGVIGDGFRFALVVSAAYAALAVMGALLLSAGRRTQDLAYLRTLGLTRRQSIGVTMIEHGIPVVAALIPGVVVGIVVAEVLESSLGLDAFVGTEAPFRVSVDWLGIGAVGVALLVLAGLAIAASAILARRGSPIQALRSEEVASS